MAVSAMQGRGPRILRGGLRLAPTQFEADTEPPRDPSESFPGHRLTRLVRSDSDLRVGCQGRSEACRGSHCARGCSIGASRDLRWLHIGEASGAVNRTSPFTHSRKFVCKILEREPSERSPDSVRCSSADSAPPATRTSSNGVAFRKCTRPAKRSASSPLDRCSYRHALR